MTLSKTFELVLEATDEDGDDLTFDVPDIPPGASFNYSRNRLYFRWHVNSPEKVRLEIFSVVKTRIGKSVRGPLRATRKRD